tara:strand:- start:3494 stop:3709 length:216 start_codon:yes stop_codon:yes gene_type:complete
MKKVRSTFARSYIKNAFKTSGIQLPADTIDMIIDHCKYEVGKMTIRCKKGNVKRLTPELFHIALGRHDINR